MKKNGLKMSVLGWVSGWAKGFLLCLLLPCLGVRAESWQGHTHYEYSGPWSWTESNCRTIQTATGFKEICDVTITGYSGNSTDLVIPDKITLYTAVSGDIVVTWEYEATVRAIGAGAFRSSWSSSLYKNLTSVTIPNTVTNIGNSAFYYCSGLTSVTIPGSVVNIGDYAFYSCTNLNNVTIPYGVERIGGGAFYWCKSIERLVIPDSVKEIDVVEGYEMDMDGAFERCYGLKSVVIGRGIKWLRQATFSDCTALDDVVLPDTLECLGEESYYNPFSPEGVFVNCVALKEITIPNNVTSIGHAVFCNCRGLTSVTIPDSVTSIWDSAFSGCSGLTSVTIPSSVTTIGSSAFDNCSCIKDVTVPQYVLDSRTISSVFPSYASITNVSYSSIITTIGNSAFGGCSGLTSVTIPDSVTSIGEQAFYNCSGLTSVTIGNSVTSIWDYAFSGCSGLTSVTIPNSVTSIRNSAFYGCCGLTSVTIGNGVTSIGDNAFYGCSGLADVAIPDNVTTMGNTVFYNCANITSVAVPQSVITMGLSSTFSSYRKLRHLRLGVNVMAISADEFGDCKELTSIEVADGNGSYFVAQPDGCLYDIGRTLLLFCPRDATHITVLGNVKEIGKYAFQHCTKLLSVTLPDGTESIGDFSFCYCTSLASVTLPNTVRTIGSYSFSGCSKLSGLTIPDSVQTLSTTAFDGCNVLWTEWYRALANLSVNGSGSSGGGSSHADDPRYALAAAPADRTISTVTVDTDCAIDSFVLTDGKVYDTVLRIVNTANHAVTLSLPSGYSYERFKGTSPLTIPANSANMLTITRTADRVFFVTREELESIQ